MGRKRSSRPLSDIDPRELQTPTGQPRKRRGPRNKPAPSEWQRRGFEEKEERLSQRPPNPGVLFEPGKQAGQWTPRSPHSDQRLWEVQLFSAFATSSPSVARQFIDDLQQLCSQDWDPQHGWKINETEFNAALAMVNDIEPQTIREAALAAQMVAVHWTSLRLAKDALNNGGMVMEKSASLLSKLTRTYAMQMEALQKERGKGGGSTRQEIHVTRENHVHYHDHRERGSDENGTRPQGPRAETIEGRASMLGHSEGNGQALPSSGDAGQEGMPQARRGKSRREEGEG